MPDQTLEQTVQKMIDAGESEENIATVIQAHSHVSKGQDVPHPIAQKLLAWLPAAAGVAGGVVGGIGGTVAGFGVGGVPGAIGGAALGGATGEAMRQLGNRTMGNPAPETSAAAGQSIVGQGVMSGVGEALGAVGGPAIRYVGGKFAPALMQSAVKPGIAGTAKALLKGVRGEDLPVVNTLLKEGVNVTPPGLMKLNRIITSTNEDIATAVQAMSGKISPQSVATRAVGTARDAAMQVAPSSDVQAVRNTVEEFLTQPGTTKAAQIGTKEVPSGVLDSTGKMLTKTEPVMGRVSRDLTPAEAQAMKVGTYRAIGKRGYGEVKGAAVETEKALARGLKEDLETEGLKHGVDLKALNLKEGNAMQAAEAVAKRLAVKGNHDILGIAWLAENPTAALAFAVSRSPAVKSLIANGAYRAAGYAAKVPEQFIRSAVTALASSPDQEQQ